MWKLRWKRSKNRHIGNVQVTWYKFNSTLGINRHPGGSLFRNVFWEVHLETNIIFWVVPVEKFPEATECHSLRGRHKKGRGRGEREREKGRERLL